MKNGPYYVVDLGEEKVFGPFDTKRIAMKERTHLRKTSASDLFLEIGTNFIIVPESELSPYKEFADNTEWIDPAGGVHYGFDGDPAAMYE